MTTFVYPENYVPPAVPSPVVLTAAQRNWIKGRIQAYITANGKTAVGKMVHLAHDRAISQYKKHIHTDVLREIVLEIRDEWGYPGQDDEVESE